MGTATHGLGATQRHLECDWCGDRRATVRAGVVLRRGLVWLFCLRCRMVLSGLMEW